MVPQSYNAHLQEETICSVGERFLIIRALPSIKEFSFSTLIQNWHDALIQRAMETMEQMKQMGVQPNLRTYTTLIHGWASASYPEKALACYDEMKAAGLKPDKALFHCIMTSLLSRAAVARETVFDGVLRVTSEMVDLGICVDLATVRHWQKYLVKAERWSGDLTHAVERIFPPDWNPELEVRRKEDAAVSLEGSHIVDTQQEGHLQEEWVSEEDEASMVN
jgi:pentatricopeptide repeat protein